MVSHQNSTVYLQEQVGLPDAGYWSIQEVSYVIHSAMHQQSERAKSHEGKSERNWRSGCDSPGLDLILLQSSLAPACRVTPTAAPDVALSVRILVGANVQFAIRGGGHTAWAGGEYRSPLVPFKCDESPFANLVQYQQRQTLEEVV